MNLGIVIGVSDYVNAGKLPGCVNDAEVVSKLLALSNKYEDVLVITENTYSKNVKSRITSFIEKYKTEKIDEILFYFSGHGLFESDEFYYALSDFDFSKKNQTSLNNEELDALLKEVSAGLTVKVVDACQSGVRYIKDTESFRKYLSTTEKHFKKCYFYFSSHNDQSSYQSNNISDFTLEFIKAFVERPEQEIRYKDIVDSLADAFDANSQQKPYFVIQAGYTENFGFLSSESCDVLKGYITSTDRSLPKPVDTDKTLLQKIQADASLYCSEDEAFSCVSNLLTTVEQHNFSTVVKDIFDLKISTHNDSRWSINTDYIGEFFSKSETNFFVKIETETRTKMVPKNSHFAVVAAAASIFGDSIPTEPKQYQAICGAKSKVDLPFHQIYILAEARYPNIGDVGCLLFPFVSQTKIAIMSAFFYYKSTEWNTKDVVKTSCVWSVIEESIRSNSSIEERVHSLLEDFEAFTLKPIEARFSN